MRHVLSWHLTSSPTVNSDDAIFMRQETDSMCTMECFSVLFTKFYYFLLILKIISWNWLAILHLYPRWSSQQHIYILFTLSSFFLCLHISPQTEGVRTLQIMSKTSHRAKIHRTGGQNPSYRGQKSNIPCYNIGLNMSPSDSFMSCLDSLQGYSAVALYALQLIVLVVFGAVD